MDDRPAPSAGDSCRLASWVCLGVAFAAAALAVPYVLFASHVMGNIFSEMKMNLPGLTALSLHPVYAGLFPALALLGLVKELLVADKRKALLLNAALVLLIVILLVQFATAMVLPYYSLMRAL